MRQPRFTDEQVVGIVRAADREPVAEVAKRHGMSEQTIYTWRKRFGELRPEDVRRLRQHCENAQAVADRLAAHPSFTRVIHPRKLTGNDAEHTAKCLPRSKGGLVGIELKSGREAGEKFINAPKPVYHVANIGDARSLAIHPPAPPSPNSTGQVTPSRTVRVRSPQQNPAGCHHPAGQNRTLNQNPEALAGRQPARRGASQPVAARPKPPASRRPTAASPAPPALGSDRSSRRSPAT
jgi:hypothetical protein